MSPLHLKFCDSDQPDLALGPGVQTIRPASSRPPPATAEAPWLLQLHHDRRGIWMTVADGVHGVHVNGRPVQQVAMLRPGDCIHVDGRKLLLYGAVDTQQPAAFAPPQDPAANLRLVLRGLGGRHHGRSVSLDQPRWIGSDANVDLPVEGEGIHGRHALIEVINGQVQLHQTADTVQVNGIATRAAILHGGDQITFGLRHRFVLEAPPGPLPPPAANADDVDAAPEPPPRGWARRVPWLLVAALLLAGGLSALLVFGPH